jgi:hypothetical protein
MAQQKRNRAEQAAELARMGALETRYVDEEGLAVYFGLSPRTLNNLRVDTPKQWTWERIEETLGMGKIPAPPFRKVGTRRIYDLRKIYMWVTLFPEMGSLPEELWPAKDKQEEEWR